MIDKTLSKQTVRGPMGLILKLDASQIYPDNPGEGTPALVYCGQETMTFWCATENWSDMFANPSVASKAHPQIGRWLDSLQNEVSEWENWWAARSMEAIADCEIGQ